jgi:tetratricopeptide (TPR) repeat protein
LMSKVIWAASLMFALVGLTPSTGNAAKVLVLPYQPMGKSVPPELTEQATVVIAKEMAQGGLTIIRADDVAEAAAKPTATRRTQDAPTGDPAAGNKAEELISRAKDFVEESEFNKAIKELKDAVRLLEENGDAVADLRLLPEAYLQLGVAHFRNGDEDEADEMLNKAVHLDPERTLDAADYPPIFIRVFDRARFNVLRRPRAMIEVKASKGAQVLFDGRNMGKAPVHLKEALPGNHWIRVERPGEPVQVKKISVKGSRTIVVEFEGGESSGADASPGVGVLGAIAGNELGKDQVAQLKAAGSRAGADFVMIGGIFKTDTAWNLRTLYISVKDGSVGRLADIAFDLDMLSAEIEVYKLAEDAKNQAKSGTLTNIVKEDRFAIATSLKKGNADRKPTKAAEETKVAVVVAAPPAPPPPEAPSIPDPAVAAAAPAKGKSNAGAAGRAPLATEGGVTKEEGSGEPPALLPKDEVGGEEKKPAPAVVASTLQPHDEDDNEPATWWIWALVGVAAVGAVSAGGILIATGGSPDEGNLRIQW